MAIVTRYFDVSAAGSGDGTSWSNRAALFGAGVWSSIITAFNFGGSSSLRCLIAGSAVITAALADGSFSVAAPTVDNPLLLLGCDASGVQIPGNLGWTSVRPSTWFDALPALTTTTNIATITVTHAVARCLAFLAAGRAGAVVDSIAHVDRCLTANSAEGSTVAGVVVGARSLTNSVIRMTSVQYDKGVDVGAGGTAVNVRIEGNPSASSSSRRGLLTSGGATFRRISMVCSFGHAGDGLQSSNTGTNHNHTIHRCVLVHNGGSGYAHTSATNAQSHVVEGSVAVGNGAYGFDGGSSRPIVIAGCRTRNNTSGGINSIGNYPSDLDHETSAGSDAAEFVDPTNADMTLRDYRIKAGSAVHGRGFGVEDQPASGGGTPIDGLQALELGVLA